MIASETVLWVFAAEAPNLEISEAGVQGVTQCR
jgi:hypothetical protein